MPSIRRLDRKHSLKKSSASAQYLRETIYPSPQKCSDDKEAFIYNDLSRTSEEPVKKVTLNEVSHIIRYLKTKITIKMLQKSPSQLIRSLTIIFNALIRTQSFPTIWQVKIYNALIQTSAHTKYLGIYLDKNLN